MHDGPSLLFMFLLSLGLTLVLEFLIALPFRIRSQDLLLFLLVNLLTNPAAVYLNLLFLNLFPHVSRFIWQIPLEIAVILCEGFLYLRLSRSLHRPWLFAIVANAVSYGTGLLLNCIL